MNEEPVGHGRQTSNDVKKIKRKQPGTQVGRSSNTTKQPHTDDQKNTDMQIEKDETLETRRIEHIPKTVLVGFIAT